MSMVDPTKVVLDKDMRKETLRIMVSKKVSLRIERFDSPSTHLPAVIFFPGWITLLIKNFPIILGLVRSGHTVYYVDTREKQSSIFIPPNHGPENFHFDRYNEDIKEIICQLGLAGETFFLLGGSFGAGLLTKYLGAGYDSKFLPEKTAMIIPATNLFFRGWQKLLIRIPLFFDKFIIKVVEWYIRTNFYNPEEPELGYQFRAQIHEFDIVKIQHSAIAIDREGGMRLRDDVTRIQDEILVIGAKNDLMHNERETRNFSRLLRNGTYLDLHSNKYTHSELFGRIASRWFSELNYHDLLDEIEK